MTVIDSHVTDYDRPGIIAQMAVEQINTHFLELGITSIDVPASGGYPPNSVFIRDLQQQLLRRARSMGVVTDAQKFRGIDAHDVVAQDVTEHTKKLPL